jgi:branched-chain amino acid transport system ATP-binding protein
VLALADKGYVLDMGRNAIEGTGAELLRDPKVTELYLGGAVAGPDPASDPGPGPLQP